MTEQQDDPVVIEQEDDKDQTGANRFDADIAKANARREMWKTVQKVLDNAGKFGGLLGLVLAGYATCSKANKTDTEEQLRQQSGVINEQADELEKTKEATRAVRDYTTAVASSASAAVVAVASATPEPAIVVGNRPTDGGCWVPKNGGLVRCTAETPAAAAIESARTPPAKMNAPAPPSLPFDDTGEPRQ